MRRQQRIQQLPAVSLYLQCDRFRKGRSDRFVLLEMFNADRKVDRCLECISHIHGEPHNRCKEKGEKYDCEFIFFHCINASKGNARRSGRYQSFFSTLGLCSVLVLQQFRNQFLFVRHRDLPPIDRKPFNAARIVPHLMDGHRLQFSNILLFVR